MKRADLIRHIESHGCLFVREESNHTVYLNNASLVFGLWSLAFVSGQLSQVRVVSWIAGCEWPNDPRTHTNEHEKVSDIKGKACRKSDSLLRLSNLVDN